MGLTLRHHTNADDTWLRPSSSAESAHLIAHIHFDTRHTKDHTTTALTLRGTCA
jgi:hypothetical protein